jgi:hypothetical protein
LPVLLPEPDSGLFGFEVSSVLVDPLEVPGLVVEEPLVPDEPLVPIEPELPLDAPDDPAPITSIRFALIVLPEPE